MARRTYASTIRNDGGAEAKMSLGTEAVTTAIATAAADTDVTGSATAPAKVTAITTALTGFTGGGNMVLNFDLAVITSRNKFNAALDAIRQAVLSNSDLT